MDGQKDLDSRDKNKYKLRVGASILDIGSINFQKGNDALDFAANNLQNWDISHLNFGSNVVKGFDSIIAFSGYGFDGCRHAAGSGIEVDVTHRDYANDATSTGVRSGGGPRIGSASVLRFCTMAAR